MHMRTLVTASALLLTALGCGDGTETPTEPRAGQRSDVATATSLTFRQVSGGLDHTCGVATDNRAYCWGDGFYGQTGDATAPWEDLTPGAVHGGLSFRHVSSGQFHTCGVTTEERVYCWGNNGYAQPGSGALGDGTTETRLTPVPVASTRQFRQVTAAGQHTCAITLTGVAFCWGYNAYGQLGDGTTTDRLRPVRVAGGLFWRQLSAGLQHTCGITVDNRTFCWGSNWVGQLGDGMTTDRLRPRLVAGGLLFAHVDAGDAHTCAVTTTDRAFCWGLNARGQLGDGTQTTRLRPRAVAGNLAFNRVTAGGSHSCGESTTNRAYCWGRNGQGQLGDGSNVSTRLKPVAVTGGLLFEQLSAGYQHTCGVPSVGLPYCWGNNSRGQLGDGTTTGRRSPTLVADPM
jgi:alpha-tubulin suppressor-like RCC1 family protein